LFSSRGEKLNTNLIAIAPRYAAFVARIEIQGEIQIKRVRDFSRAID
jgi:hypothetical protein